jgi:hypothetical protein
MKYQHKFIKDWATIYVTADEVGGRQAEGAELLGRHVAENVHQFFP